ncbi:ShlB/FhaC/HecB family hemolysin secretion/activation protein [Pseudomonadota bacterium]
MRAETTLYCITKLLLLSIFGIFSPLTALAAGPVAPGAGTILQEAEPVTPLSPSSAEPGLRVEEDGGTPFPPSDPFMVKTIRISGNTLFDTETLHGLVADMEGKTLTLSQLTQLAARITDYYHSHGYPLARAIIPPQVIRDGVVEFVVIEARYGKIKLDNHSRVNDTLLQATLSPVQSGQVIAEKALNRSLLLLSDIQGTATIATLKPGDRVGTSDLLVEVAPGPVISGNIVLDNFGNRYTGKARAGLALNINNPLRHGDVLSVGGLSSGKGMNYGRIAYETLLNGKGTRTGGSYSALRYVLGDTLTYLNGHGSAQVGSVWVRHPLMRSRDVNLYGRIQYDRKQLRDRIDVAAIRTDRHLNRWAVNLSGDARDTFLSGGINLWNVSWTGGNVLFEDSAAQLADAVTAGTKGRFSKWNASFARQQRLSSKSTLYFSVYAQLATTNLDASEKMIAGGPHSVRAYDISALSGDEGYQGNVELRHDLGPALYGQWQIVAFADGAHLRVNNNAWVAGVNSATLTGAGIGLNWTGPKQLTASVYVATRVGPVPVLVGNTSSVHAWGAISKAF